MLKMKTSIPDDCLKDLASVQDSRQWFATGMQMTGQCVAVVYEDYSGTLQCSDCIVKALPMPPELWPTLVARVGAPYVTMATFSLSPQ